VKLFSAQLKLSSRGLSYLYHVKPSGLSRKVQINFGLSRGLVWTLDWAKRLSPGWAKSLDWTVAETKRKILLHFLAYLRLNLVLGSVKRLSHGLSQKVKSPIAIACWCNCCMYWTCVLCVVCRYTRAPSVTIWCRRVTARVDLSVLLRMLNVRSVHTAYVHYKQMSWNHHFDDDGDYELNTFISHKADTK